MKRILIVEDDENFRQILQNVLKKSGYYTDIAQDGKVAQHVLTLSDFDAILSDIRMPNLNGIDLLHWVKAQGKGTPVILMTGFSEILETKEAFELGAEGFLAKPFQQQELLQVLKEVTEEDSENESSEEDVIAKDMEYCKVAIDDFVTGKQIPYSIYVQLNPGKYVKVAHIGEDISLDRIKAYKKNGMTYLYLRKEDFTRYVGLNLKLAKIISKTNKIDRVKKHHFIRQTGEVIMEKLFIEGVNPESFNNAKDFLETSLSTLTESEESYNMLQILNNHSDSLYAHSVGVSLYGVMIAKKMKWTSAPTLFKVSLGGLFHDVGKKEIKREIIEKPRALLTQEERAIIETHPARGLEILNQLTTIPADISQIAYQHHEDCTGYGYPLGISRSRIHPIARLISVANIFCEYAVKGPQGDGMSGTSAIYQMLQFRKDGLDSEPLKALCQIFNYPLEEKKAS